MHHAQLGPRSHSLFRHKNTMKRCYQCSIFRFSLSTLPEYNGASIR
jgi:hypothetical protein